MPVFDQVHRLGSTVSLRWIQVPPLPEHVGVHSLENTLETGEEQGKNTLETGGELTIINIVLRCDSLNFNLIILHIAYHGNTNSSIRL